MAVLDWDDDNFWTKKAYLIPDTPGANITPEEKDVKMIPINRMVPRSFFTNLKNGWEVGVLLVSRSADHHGQIFAPVDAVGGNGRNHG